MTEEPEGNSRRGALIAMVVIVVLIAAVVLIVQRLNTAGTMQDCLASGRTNCAPVQTR